MMLICVLLLTVAPLGSSDSLEQRASEFWRLLAAGDKYAALEYVHPESRNAFIRRQDPLRRNPKILRTELLSEREALVEVQFDRYMESLGRFHELTVKQRWKLEGGKWSVLIAEASPELYKQIFASQKSTPPPAGTLSIVPSRLRLSFFDQPQIGRLAIRNGLAIPVSLKTIELNHDLFEVVERPVDRIAPGENGVITLEYIGQAIGKNKPSKLKLIVAAAQREQVFEIDFLYNYLDESTLHFLGLTREEAERLKPGQAVKPNLSLPEKIKNRPNPLPEELKKPEPEKPPELGVRS